MDEENHDEPIIIVIIAAAAAGALSAWIVWTIVQIIAEVIK